MEQSQKQPALLFCHPSMEDLAKAIAKRCSHTPSSADSVNLSASLGKSHFIGNHGDIPFLQVRKKNFWKLFFFPSKIKCDILMLMLPFPPLYTQGGGWGRI